MGELTVFGEDCEQEISVEPDDDFAPVILSSNLNHRSEDVEMEFTHLLTVEDARNLGAALLDAADAAERDIEGRESQDRFTR
jgi:hypothetical protein